MAEKTTPAAKPAPKKIDDKTNTAQEVKDFKSCVAGGGKISFTDNGDGTVSQTCTLNKQQFNGPKQAKPADNKKAEATNMEQATAAVKLTKLSVESDGTKDGTKILLNGKAIANLSSLSFNFYPDSNYYPMSFSYSTRDPDPKPGEMSSYTHYTYRCPQPTSCYANNRAVANATPDNSFVVTKHSTDPLAPPAPTTGKTAYAAAFNPSAK